MSRTSSISSAARWSRRGRFELRQWADDEYPAGTLGGARAIGGATSRPLLVADDPDAVMRRAVEAGATEKSRACDEHGWRLGRIVDPFGHEWEIGKPIGAWPPA